MVPCNAWQLRGKGVQIKRYWIFWILLFIMTKVHTFFGISYLQYEIYMILSHYDVCLLWGSMACHLWVTFVAVPLLLIVSTGTCFKSVLLLYGKFLFVVVVVARVKTCFCVHMWRQCCWSVRRENNIAAAKTYLVETKDSGMHKLQCTVY